MKRICLSLAIGALMLGLATSCSGDGKPLSASSAKSALKKEAIFAKDSQVKEFEIGFQEVNDEELQKLARLKAAGVITYSVEKAIEKRESRRGNYWYGYYTVTDEILHVFANVQLTEQGKKYVVEKPTKLRADIAKDMSPNENYEEVVPDYMNAGDNAFGTQPEVVKPKTEEVVAVEEETFVDSVNNDSVVVEEAVEEVETPAPAAKKSTTSEYEAMQARTGNTETVNVLLGRFEIVKVKEVLCTDKMFEEGNGSCTLLYKFVDKTPFGYVYGAPAENYIESTKINFIHYQDMGWTVAN